QLVRGQRCLVVPAVRQAAEALVGQPLVMQLLERPYDAFHVGQVERLVVVLEIDPASLPGDVVTPRLAVAQYRLAACLVEPGDAELPDVFPGPDAELAHRLQLGGQAVGIPAEPALDPLTPHGLIPRDQVLDVAGEQMPVMRQAVRERRPRAKNQRVRRRFPPPGGAGAGGREACRGPPGPRAPAPRPGEPGGGGARRRLSRRLRPWD